MNYLKKQNEILNSNNININNLTGNNTKNNIIHNNINNIENLNQHIQGKFTNYFNCDLNKYDENNNKYFPHKKVKNISFIIYHYFILIKKMLNFIYI